MNPFLLFRKLSTGVLLSTVLIFLVSAIYFNTSFHEGNFWWSDAPRHALDGVFYLDVFKDLPFSNPIQYAYNYYIHYPALTILFYPPFFAIVEAVFYAVFGVSHATAQLTVSFFAFMAGLGAFQLSRRWLPIEQALAVALLFLGSHEIAFWGRQVMLDIPAYAFLLWSSVILFQYLDTQNTKLLYLLAIVFGLGIYTKLNIIFILPVYVATIFYQLGRKVWINPHVWWAGILFSVVILPWCFVILKYGQVNMDAAMGGQTANELSRLTWEGWLFYARAIPAQVGLLPAILAFLYLLFAVKNKKWLLPKTDLFFVISWFIWGYIFFSLIALKEYRHSVFILYPVVLLSIILIYNLFRNRMVSGFLSISMALFFLGNSMVYGNIPHVNGYKQAADIIAQYAPQRSAVLFSGYRDGSFIFNMRTHPERSDLIVLRADKMLLKYAVKRSMGVEEREFTEQQIIELINESGVKYIVAQPGFWDDLKVMQRFENVLASEQFEKFKTIDVKANTHHKDKQLIIYKNLGVVKKLPESIRIELPIIGIDISGKT